MLVSFLQLCRGIELTGLVTTTSDYVRKVAKSGTLRTASRSRPASNSPWNLSINRSQEHSTDPPVFRAAVPQA